MLPSLSYMAVRAPEGMFSLSPAVAMPRANNGISFASHDLRIRWNLAECTDYILSEIVHEKV